MTNLLRRISQCQRVLWGFLLMSALCVALCGIGVHGLRSVAAEVAAHAPQRAAEQADTMIDWLIAATAAVATFGAAMGLAIRASIKAPLEATVQAVIRIGSGDLDTKVQSAGRDELSWLNHELNQMRKKLRDTVRTVSESIGTVNSATDEIARGNSDLSTRTENQASALQETASSMEQLSDTVHQNARHASEAAQLVSQTTHIAQQGDTLMRDVVTRMSEINSSSARITEIIGVIDGIAFQTNILALNAAVEAARAGDHGRGFAVVAAEVRTLAQRSANAAKEIKTLIGDSTEKVDAGSQLVDQAGRTMQNIMTSVSRVSGIVTDMAAAGQQQSDGISQIHAAVGQLDGMTQQNAALVEQAAAASQSLKAQADRLSRAMSAFKVAA